tara:strand:- start:37 stop:510 length:474 start_codon:yes stop_codon:yes gene_type:complete
MRTVPVDQVDESARVFMENMLETMYAANGIGLAAPQVGDDRSVIVVDCARKGEAPAPIKMANPEIIEVSAEQKTHQEGCLSLPEHYAEVVRPKSIRMRYLDDTNIIRELNAEGMLATCIQHEIDHLAGVLFIDHISSLKRNMILRKLKKVKKQSSEN